MSAPAPAPAASAPVASSTVASAPARAHTLRSSGLMGRFVLIGIGVWLHAADSLVTATVAPALVEDLGGIAYLNWTISLYQVGAIIAGAISALLAVRWRIKRVFIGATLLYGAGCVLSALAPNMAILLAGRLIQGLGGGMLLSLCYVAVEAWFAPELWPRLFAFVAAIWGGGSLLGPLIGGAFADVHAWRGAFWAFTAQAAVLALLASRYMPAAPPGARTQHSPMRQLLALSAATLLIAGAGAAVGHRHGIALATAAALAGIALLYVAARLDRAAAARLLPAQLLDVAHPLSAGLLMVFTLAAGTVAFWAYGPLLLKTLFDTRPLVTGYILAAEALAWSGGTLAAAATTDRDQRWLIRCGAATIAAGGAGFALAVPSGLRSAVVACALLQGAGFGICWPALVGRVVRYAHPAERALASTSVSTMQRIGYAVGTAAVGIVANLSGLADGVSAAAARSAAVWVFVAFLPLLALGVVFAWRFTSARAESQLP